MQNPFQMLAQFQRNPMGAIQQQMLQKMESQNPQLFQKVMGMVGGKSESEMEQFARNLAKERGVNIDETISSVKSLLGMK